MNIHQWMATERGYKGTCEGYMPDEMCEPTQCQPGSPEKIEVLAERVEAGQWLWHQDDRSAKPEHGKLVP